MRMVQGAHRDLTMSLAISPDGKTMASCDSHGLVMLRDMLDWQSVRTYTYSEKGHSVWSLSFSPDGRYLAIGGTEPGIVLLDLRAGCKELRVSPPITQGQGTRILAGWSHSRRDVDSTRARPCSAILCWVRPCASSPVLQSPCPSVFSPDGRTLACGGRDGNISLWDVATGDRKLRLEGELGPVFSVAFSPDGTLLASTGTAGPQVKLWEASTGRLVQSHQGESTGDQRGCVFARWQEPGQRGR